MLSRDEWNLGIVAQTADDILQRGIVTPVRWLNRDSWRILADPFCYQAPDGRWIVLAERLNHWVGRGEIWAATLPTDGSLSDSDFRPLARSIGHLSYPSIVTDRGTCYLTMEHFESGGLQLWPLPSGRPIRVLDRPAIDPTFHRDDAGMWWLFCTFPDSPNENLHVFYCEALDGVWKPHAANPVVTSLRSARPAGSLFKAQHGLIRPGQNSVETYGGGLVLNQVVKLTPTQYFEAPVRTFYGLDEYYRDGFHSFAPAGRFTVIDGKRWHHQVVSNAGRKVVAKVFKSRRLAQQTRMVASVQLEPALLMR